MVSKQELIWLRLGPLFGKCLFKNDKEDRHTCRKKDSNVLIHI